MGHVVDSRILERTRMTKRQAKFRLAILIFAASVHLFAAALCLTTSKKAYKMASSWAKQAKSTVNMERHRKRRCKLDPLFSI